MPCDRLEADPAFGQSLAYTPFPYAYGYDELGKGLPSWSRYTPRERWSASKAEPRRGVVCGI